MSKENIKEQPYLPRVHNKTVVFVSGSVLGSLVNLTHLEVQWPPSGWPMGRVCDAFP